MHSQVTIEHFKSLADMTIRLDDVTVFVGKNSVGKSNIVESLLFLRDCLERGLDYATSERYGIDSILQWSRTRPFKLSIRVNIVEGDDHGHYGIRLSSKNREPIIVGEDAYWFSADASKSQFFRREGETLSISGFSEDIERILTRNVSSHNDDEFFINRARIFAGPNNGMQRLYRSIISTQSYSIFPNILRAPQKPSKDGMLSQSGDNITSILKTMVSSKTSRLRHSYSEVVESMKLVIPNLSRILVRNISGLLWLAFEVSEGDGHAHQLNTTQISDGALRILGILVALYQPQPPRVLAIEEPEQNLHPGALGLIAEAIKERSEYTQLLVTTHSPHLLDHFDVECIRNVYLAGGLTKVSTVDDYQRDAIKSGLISAGEIMTNHSFLSE